MDEIEISGNVEVEAPQVTGEIPGTFVVGIPGPAGPKGEPGKDGSDGYTPVRGTDYWTPTDKNEIVEEVLEQLPDIPEGSGGGSAIIDVAELPTENIREDVFYRVVKGSVLVGKLSVPIYVVHCVETLPETGLPVTNVEQTEANVYVTLSDYEAYGYVDAMLSQALGIPTGWYPITMILNSLGYEYAGVITSLEETYDDSRFRIFLNFITYSHINGAWTSYEKVGTSGPYNSVKFNDPGNGVYDYSFATGINTDAHGVASFTMGEGTEANGMYTLAIGSYNDSSYVNSVMRGTHVFVVGNGTSDANRSNAHTLDWDGNAWFAGSVYVGGTGQNDPNAVKIPTASEVQEMINAALGVIENGSY